MKRNSDQGLKNHQCQQEMRIQVVIKAQKLPFLSFVQFPKYLLLPKLIIKVVYLLTEFCLPLMGDKYKFPLRYFIQWNFISTFLQPHFFLSVPFSVFYPLRYFYI